MDLELKYIIFMKISISYPFIIVFIKAMMMMIIIIIEHLITITVLIK
jgi:hypothetical protein